MGDEKKLSVLPKSLPRCPFSVTSVHAGATATPYCRGRAMGFDIRTDSQGSIRMSKWPDPDCKPGRQVRTRIKTRSAFYPVEMRQHHGNPT
jgi:hypothetical protein